MTVTCSSCDAELTSHLVCAGCGELQKCDTAPSPFESFGLTPGQAIDRTALKQGLLKLSRAMHPDFFGNADEETRQLAVDNTAELNSAHKILADNFRRADWLVRSLDGPGEDTERQMPQAFLMEVMEWNELIEEARDKDHGSSEREAVAKLETTLQTERVRLMDDVGKQLDPLPERAAPSLTEIRKLMNAVRYLDRALRQVTELAIRATNT